MAGPGAAVAQGSTAAVVIHIGKSGLLAKLGHTKIDHGTAIGGNHDWLKSRSTTRIECAGPIHNGDVVRGRIGQLVFSSYRLQGNFFLPRRLVAARLNQQSCGAVEELDPGLQCKLQGVWLVAARGNLPQVEVEQALFILGQQSDSG